MGFSLGNSPLLWAIIILWLAWKYCGFLIPLALFGNAVRRRLSRDWRVCSGVAAIVVLALWWPDGQELLEKFMESAPTGPGWR